MDYLTKDGQQLIRSPAMFYWRGRYFSGLVTFGNALYDDPEDSFAEHVGIKSSLEQGLIVQAKPE